ncbi:MAG TPA: RNA polymerase sigma factor [Longimicrobium sp.]
MWRQRYTRAAPGGRPGNGASNLASHPDVQPYASRNGRRRPGATPLIQELHPPPTGDPALAAAGDAHAFGRLYRDHVARVHTLACRMIGDDDADEVTQDVFVRAWEKLRTFRGEAAFGTWLHRLAVNLILARRTSRSVRHGRDGGAEALETIACRPAAPELKMDFERAIKHLPDGARQIFVLFDVEGYRHEEIAEMLNVSVGTSKSQLHRARMILREHLT